MHSGTEFIPPEALSAKTTAVSRAFLNPFSVFETVKTASHKPSTVKENTSNYHEQY